MAGRDESEGGLILPTTANAAGNGAGASLPAGFVQTVLGPVDPADLGMVLPHEHFFLDLRFPRADEAMRQRLADALMADERGAAEEARDLLALGVRTVVDCTTSGMGRNAEALRRLSAVTGLQVVCATGFYMEAFHPEHVARSDADTLAAEMLAEIESGIGDSGIRAGIVKLGSTRSPLAGDERRCFEAGGRVQAATGVPVTTHSSTRHLQDHPHGTQGLEQLDVLEAAGADPNKVIIGHLDHLPKLEVQVAVARSGAYVELDGVGNEMLCTDQQRADMVAALFEKGLGERVLLSHDRSRVTQFRASGGPGYGFLLREFLPRLRSVGLGDSEVNTLLVENPRRVLTRQPRPEQ